MHRFLSSPNIRSLAELPEYVARREDAVEVVSLDVFDTLLWRVWRHDQVVENAVRGLHARLREHSADVPAVDVLLEHRQEFESRAEAATRRAGGEWALSEWFQSVCAEWGLDQELVSRLGARAQLDVERAGTLRASGAVDVLAELRDRGIRTVATSDTYLSDNMLADLLSDYELVFEYVIASASLGVSKRRGGLFRTLARRLDVSEDAILHVGDNLKSDAIRPAEAGCQFLWLPRFAHRPPTPAWGHGDRPIPGTDWGEVRRALDAPLAAGKHTAEYRFACDWLAPIFCVYAVWAWRRLRSHDVTDLIFVAREGRLLHRVLEALSDQLPGLPHMHYAHLSRRAVTLAMRQNWLLELRGVPGKLGDSRFVDVLGQFDLPESLAQQLLEDAGLEASDPIDLEAKRAWRGAVMARSKRIDEVRSRCRRHLRAYLETLVGHDQLHRLALADSGWAGTIQEAVASAISGQETVTGLYLGVSNQGATPCAQSQKFGLLRDDYRPGLRVPSLKAAGVIRVLELIAADPEEPTTLGLRAGPDGVEPMLGESRTLSPRHRSTLDALEEGLMEGVRMRSDGVRYLARRGEGVSLEALETYSRLFARAALCFPPRAVATSLLEIDFDEGARTTDRSSLDLAGLVDGTTWVPGVLAKYHLGWLQSVLDATASLYDRRLAGN